MPPPLRFNPALTYNPILLWCKLWPFGHTKIQRIITESGPINEDLCDWLSWPRWSVESGHGWMKQAGGLWAPFTLLMVWRHHHNCLNLKQVNHHNRLVVTKSLWMIYSRWRFGVFRKWKYFSVPSHRAHNDNNNNNDRVFNHIITIIINSWYFIVVNHWVDVQYLFNTDYVIKDNMIQVQIYYSLSSGCSFSLFLY